jgi:uncharacterized repeat protein (TIGR01451 family)
VIICFLENAMNDDSFTPIRSRFSRARQLSGVSSLAIVLVISQVSAAYATIDNTATPAGTYNALPVPTVNNSTVNIPVAPATPTLTVVKTAGVPVDTTADGIIGAGDKITYTYVVTNTGNVTINAARPTDVGPTFNTVAGTGTMSAFTPVSISLIPGANQSFTATYTLSAVDAYRAAGIIKGAVGDAAHAVENTASATGTPVIGTLGAVTPSLAETQIPGNAALSIVKTWAFFTPAGDVNGNGKADKGDKIVYTYTVTNGGNTTITGVTVADTHEAVALPAGTVTNEALVSDGPLAPGTTSTDAAVNASWDTLRPGAVIKFTYTHTVTQAEVDAG